MAASTRANSAEPRLRRGRTRATGISAAIAPWSINTYRVPKRDGFRDVVSDQNCGEAIRQPNLLEQTLHLDAR